MNLIRIFIADDQSLFREGLRMLISVQAGFEVVGDVVNGEEALRLASTLQPDVILMDVRMPVLDGVGATQKLKKILPNCHVIVLTTFDDDEYVFEALRAGAIGYLLKDAPSEKLFEAIRAGSRGESFLQPAVASKVVAEFARLADRTLLPQQVLAEPLYEREREILQFIADGASNRDIANRLVIAEGTVKNHVTNILAKMGVSDRTKAAIMGHNMGLF
jgi:DNA-binding NarL/FixJ family response regulator